MKGIRAGAISLLLGCSISGVLAEEVSWKAVGKRPAATVPAPAAAGNSKPAVSLGQPVPQKSSIPRNESPVVFDPHVMPASFRVHRGPVAPRVVRMQDAELPPILPEPMWPEQEENPPEKPADKPAEVVPYEVAPRPDPVWGSLPTTAPAYGPAVPSEPCAPNGCNEGCTVCRQAGRTPGRLYGGAEYLLWWIKDSPIPPLVTTSPPGTQPFIGLPGTRILFGGSDVDNDERSGGRFTLGYWLDPCQTWGLEGTFFFLGERAARFGATSNQFPVLGRPFFNVNTGMEFAEFVTAPGVSEGGIGILMPSELWGVEANLRRNLCCGCGYRFDLLGGFRYLDLHEGVNIVEQGSLLAPFPVAPFFPAGSRFRATDLFDTRNQFYGPQLGLETELRRGRWFVNMRGKVALGVNHETVNIVGSQVWRTPDGTRSVFRGGLLALPSNIGNFQRDHFAIVPEGGVNVGCNLTDSLRAYVGYTFLYWNNVFRPGDQIDRVLDVNQIPNFVAGPPANVVRPIVPFRQTDFWAQGFNFGVEWRY